VKFDKKYTIRYKKWQKTRRRLIAGGLEKHRKVANIVKNRMIEVQYRMDLI